ncbi:MAG: GspE/PulE family protein [Longimicrobiales bacterium]
MDALQEATGRNEGHLLRCFAERLGMPLMTDLSGECVDENFASAVGLQFARRQGVVGLAGDGPYLRVATCRPLATEAVEDVAKVLNGRPVRPVLAPRAEIVGLLEREYKGRMGNGARVSEDVGSLDSLVAASTALAASEDLLDLTSRPPLVRLVNRLLLQALEARASDVHFQPASECVQVRFRVDGVLHDTAQLPKAVQRAVVSRVKVMAGMDIAERRVAQDGRATVTLGDRHVDLRVSSLPTSFGEQVVIRLLDRSRGLMALGELGMDDDMLGRFRGLIDAPHGIILVTGPTGSGKTTTLYAALRELNRRARHIVTLEDPIEYRLGGVSQSQVNRKKGMTFAGGLRNVLRQDPDIILVGEIRDLETARMAIQSALTGHLVFSTLHTNDAVSAAPRLLELGIEPYLVASSLVGVLAQRLVRKVCGVCAAPARPEQALLERAGVEGRDGSLRAGRGCEECLHTGYRGRTGIFELMEVDGRAQEAIMRRDRPAGLRRELAERGWRGMREDGVAKALRGVTTLEEVLRVTQDGTIGDAPRG